MKHDATQEELTGELVGLVELMLETAQLIKAYPDDHALQMNLAGGLDWAKVLLEEVGSDSGCQEKR